MGFLINISLLDESARPFVDLEMFTWIIKEIF